MYAPSVATAFTPGELIGSKYRVVRLLGAGGMGIVLEATHELTAKRVAIKRLRPQLAEHPEHVQRMLREAQASARIAHDNVVDIYDVGADGDSVFLVMEYLEGETLGAMLARGPLSPHEALALLVPAMRGVVEAHALGIVHRDIKPDNIFLARAADGTCVPKVLDFGISKLPREADSVTLTSSGMTLGTPLYMAYEQLTGLRDVDARADVYAFGVILYEALTGSPPFRAESLGSLAVKVATSTPRRASQVNDALPAELDAILARALARDRDARFQTLTALITALAPFTTVQSHASSRARMAARRARSLADTVDIASQVGDTPPSRAKRRKYWLAAGCAALLGAALFARVHDWGAIAPAVVTRDSASGHAPTHLPDAPASSTSRAWPSAPADPALPAAVAKPTLTMPVKRARSPRREESPSSLAPALTTQPAAARGAREDAAGPTPPSPRLRAGRPTLDQF